MANVTDDQTGFPIGHTRKGCYLGRKPRRSRRSRQHDRKPLRTRGPLRLGEGTVVDAGMLGLLAAAVSGFLGWRIGTAQDAVRIKYQADTIRSLTDRVDSLHKELTIEARQFATSLSEVNASLNATASLLNRMDQRLAKLEDQHNGLK